MSTEQTRYWCHVCNIEVPIYMAPEPTCQHCNEQFIEELHSDDDPREFLAGAETQNEGNGTLSTDGSGRPSGDTTMFSFGPRPREQDSGESGEEVFQFFAPRSANENDENRTTGEGGPSPLTNMIQSMLTNIMGENMEGRAGADANQPMLFYGDYVNGSFRFRSANGNADGASANENQQGDSDGADNTQGEGENGGARINGINSILQYLAAITGGTFDGGMVGNPNDYVFSQTALDNIITQLMEQTAGASAPPPATDQVIESLKKRSLTDEEKKQETDCAVCKDAFEMEETVIELPCEHIFHDDCIKPWLKLNGTCPVCRHSVSPENKEQDVTNENSENSENNENNENNENTSSSEATQNNPSSNRNNPPAATATFTFINGQPVQGNSALSGSLQESIASLFQSVGAAQHSSASSNNNQQSSQTSSSNNNDDDDDNDSDSQHQSNNNSDQASSQQKASTDNSNNSNNNNNNSELDQDSIYMDLD